MSKETAFMLNSNVVKLTPRRHVRDSRSATPWNESFLTSEFPTDRIVQDRFAGSGPNLNGQVIPRQFFRASYWSQPLMTIYVRPTSVCITVADALVSFPIRCGERPGYLVELR